MKRGVSMNTVKARCGRRVSCPMAELDPFGAVPAVSGHARAPVGNQVSADGSRAFFVSPDPASCERMGAKQLRGRSA